MPNASAFISAFYVEFERREDEMKNRTSVCQSFCFVIFVLWGAPNECHLLEMYMHTDNRHIRYHWCVDSFEPFVHHTSFRVCVLVCCSIACAGHTVAGVRTFCRCEIEITANTQFPLMQCVALMSYRLTEKTERKKSALGSDRISLRFYVVHATRICHRSTCVVYACDKYSKWFFIVRRILSTE